MTIHARCQLRWATCLLALLGLPLLAWQVVMASAEPLPAPPLGYPPLATEVMVPSLKNGDEELAVTTEAITTVQKIELVTGSPFMPLMGGQAQVSGDTSLKLDTTEASLAAEPGPTMVETPAEPIEPPPLVPLDVMLDWYPSPQHAALYVAQALGLYEQRGLSVTLSTPADPDVPLKLLAAGRVELALSRQPLLHREVDRGLPLIRVATLIGTPLAGLVLREDLDIDSPGGLAGLRIGYATEDGLEVLLTALLRQYDIRRDELEMQGVGFELDGAMSAREVDGVIGSMRHLLPRQLGDEGMATRMLRVENHGVPLHDGLILIANRDRLSKSRSAMRLLVEALEEATAWIIEYPDEAWELLIDTEPGLDTPSSHAAWPDILRRLSIRPAAFDHGRYARFEAFLHKHAMDGTLTPVERLATDLGAP